MDTTSKKFTEGIKALIKKNNMSAQYVANKINYSGRHLRGCLKEEKGIGKNLANLLVDFFDTTYEDTVKLGKWILDGNDPVEFKKEIDYASAFQLDEQYHQMLTKTLSNKKYRTAIIHNLEAFSRVAEADEEIEEKRKENLKMKDELVKMNERMERLEDLIVSLGAKLPNEKRDKTANG